jgi:hypothetical protein
MKCVGTQKLTGRKHVLLEHISGDNAILTRKFQRIKCPLIISSFPHESRDVSLRVTLKTLIDDVEETYCVMQVLKENEAQDGDKLEEKKESEEVDLGYIDLFEPDPDHWWQTHTNKKLSTQWKIEKGIEMKDLFDRGCLIKTKRSDLPKGARIVGSRFQYKIKRHHAITWRFHGYV